MELTNVDPPMPADEFEARSTALAAEVWQLIADRTHDLAPSDRTAVTIYAASSANLRALAVGMTATCVVHGVPLARALPTPEELVVASCSPGRTALIAELVLRDLQGAVCAQPLA